MPRALSEAARVLGERIRIERQKLGVSQDDVANLAGINVSNYGKIERGLSNPTFHTVIRIAAVLDIDPSILVGGLGVESLPAQAATFSAKDFVRERRERSL